MQTTSITVEIPDYTIEEWMEDLPTVTVYSWWDEALAPRDLEAFFEGKLGYQFENTIRLTGDEGKVHFVKWSDLKAAMQELCAGDIKYVPAEQGRKLVHRLLSEQWDVSDLDVLLQAAAWNEMVYS